VICFDSNNHNGDCQTATKQKIDINHKYNQNIVFKGVLLKTRDLEPN